MTEADIQTYRLGSYDQLGLTSEAPVNGGFPYSENYRCPERQSHCILPAAPA